MNTKTSLIFVMRALLLTALNVNLLQIAQNVLLEFYKLIMLAVKLYIVIQRGI